MKFHFPRKTHESIKLIYLNEIKNEKLEFISITYLITVSRQVSMRSIKDEIYFKSQKSIH